MWTISLLSYVQHYNAPIYPKLRFLAFYEYMNKYICIFGNASQCYYIYIPINLIKSINTLQWNHLNSYRI